MKLRSHLHFARIRVQNVVRRSQDYHKHVFIMCGARGGSTLLTRLISTSPNASLSNTLGNLEGERLPGICIHKQDWPRTRKIMKRYWDPSKIVHVEKSPQNLFYGPAIQSHFHPAYFICLTRNPYAHAEGLLRRGMDDAGERVVKMFEAHRRNRELRNTLYISYRELTESTEDVCEKIIGFLPELEWLNPRLMHMYGGSERRIVNMDPQKVQALSDEDRETLDRTFARHADLFGGFGYSVPSDRTRPARAVGVERG